MPQVTVTVGLGKDGTFFMLRRKADPSPNGKPLI
jgi:hypothetical protein